MGPGFPGNLGPTLANWLVLPPKLTYTLRVYPSHRPNNFAMDNAPSTHAMKKAHGIEVGERVYVKNDNHEYKVTSIVRLYEENPADGTTYFLLRDYGVSLQCVHEKNVTPIPR